MNCVMRRTVTVFATLFALFNVGVSTACANDEVFSETVTTVTGTALSDDRDDSMVWD